MILGRTDELMHSGGYVSEEIAGYPVFIVLDGDGHPWGYHNVCPHRAGPILPNGRGVIDTLQCRYHGWCFSFEGALVDAPGFGDAVALPAGSERLSEISMGRAGQMLCWTQVLPRGPHETMLAFDVFTLPGGDDKPLRDLCAQLVRDDQPICAAVHANMAAGVYGGAAPSSSHEHAVSWFQSRILAAVEPRSGLI